MLAANRNKQDIFSRLTFMLWFVFVLALSFPLSSLLLQNELSVLAFWEKQLGKEYTSGERFFQFCQSISLGLFIVERPFWFFWEKRLSDEATHDTLTEKGCSRTLSVQSDDAFCRTLVHWTPALSSFSSLLSCSC